MSFEAKFNGTECARCEERIREGQMIEYVLTEGLQEVLVHVVCPEMLDVHEGLPCPRCFVIMPLTGHCGDCDE